MHISAEFACDYSERTNYVCAIRRRCTLVD